MDEAEFEDLMRIQRMALRSVTNESETDDKIKLMNIINDLVTDKNKKIQKESILLEAQIEGMTETDIERILEFLKRDRFIKELGDGFITRI